MGRIRSAERTEVHPHQAQTISERTFLPVDADLGRSSEGKFVMPTKPLPPNPDLAHLKNQAKDLLRAHQAHTLDVCQRIREFHPRFYAASDDDIGAEVFRLSDAQLTIAREYGFSSWSRLRAQLADPRRHYLQLPKHERIEDAAFRRAVDLLDAGDANGLRAHLLQNPKLVREHVTFEGDNYFTRPTLLEFVAENPTRRGRLPQNIVEVARIVLDAGGKADRSSMNSTLALASSSSVARQCGVQIALIDLLCEYGADPNAGMLDALLYGEFDAVDALVRHGATIDLTTAAATGRVEDVASLLPGSDIEDRQRALGLAAQYGHDRVIGLLLGAGADPNRYSPVGAHSHATPLHQAAYSGQEQVVRLLVERGARTDIKDLHFDSTPLGWAEHSGHQAIAEYLRAQADETAH
jgi:hypothetical protein